jgi:hypothetical protein
MDGYDALFRAESPPELRVFVVRQRNGYHDDRPAPAAGIAMHLSLAVGLHVQP